MRYLGMIWIAVLAIACGGARPTTQGGRSDLENKANLALETMMRKDPTLRPLIDRSAGYVVFPDVGKGGFVVGAAHGRGVLFQGGRVTGFIELAEASFGAQAGAQSFSELIVLHDQYSVDRVRSGSFSVGGNISAIVLTSGAGASADVHKGVSVFVNPKGGVMAEVSVAGQKLNFAPVSG